MIYASNGAEWYIERAGKNGLRLCGDATWEGISRSISRQWCGQPRRVVIRRDCIFKTYWTQEFMSQKIHFETDGDFRRRRFRWKPRFLSPLSRLQADSHPQILLGRRLF